MLQSAKNIFYKILLTSSINMAISIVAVAQPISSIPKVLVAPAFYEIVIPRLQANPSILYHNLFYEGNNVLMRETKTIQPDSSIGYFISMRWRKIVGQTKATFVLRDALFSQQDHPYEYVPFALLFPANWITAACLQKDSIQLMLSPSIYDEKAWCAIKTPQQMFGSFPPSEKLFKLATKRPDFMSDTVYTYNARATIQVLAKYSKRLADRRKFGIQALIDEGANIIAESDTLYFSKEIRQKNIIPIMVENPTQHEILEGKGIRLISDDTILNETVAAIRRVVYKRRLSDGDIAIERYDLSNAQERKRAIHVLEELIPKESSGALVWLWVTGKLLRDKNLQGEDASAYIGQFQQEIRVSNINASRLRFVNKPSVHIFKNKAKQSLHDTVERMRQLDLYESVNLKSEQFKYIINSN